MPLTRQEIQKINIKSARIASINFFVLCFITLFLYYIKEHDFGFGNVPNVRLDKQNDKIRECNRDLSDFLGFFNYIIFCKTVLRYMERKTAIKKAQNPMSDYLDKDIGYVMHRLLEIFILNNTLVISIIKALFQVVLLKNTDEIRCEKLSGQYTNYKFQTIVIIIIFAPFCFIYFLHTMFLVAGMIYYKINPEDQRQDDQFLLHRLSSTWVPMLIISFIKKLLGIEVP